MGGYGIIATVAIITIATLPLIWIVFQATVSQQTYTLEAIARVSEIDRRTESVKIEILNNTLTWDNPRRFTVKIINNGDEGIHFRDFKYMTLIFDYISKGNRIIRYIPYNQDGGLEYWRILSVYQSGYTTELVNPFRTGPDGNSGIWDPDEIIEIEVWLYPTLRIDEGTSYTLLISTPNGAYDVYRGVYE